MKTPWLGSRPESSAILPASSASIAAGNALVRAIAPLARSTRRSGADADLGGFGGIFDPKAAGFKDPLLVAANDGVGTKLKLAIEHNAHDGVGIDLVAMCANDLIVRAPSRCSSSIISRPARSKAALRSA